MEYVLVELPWLSSLFYLIQFFKILFKSPIRGFFLFFFSIIFVFSIGQKSFLEDQLDLFNSIKIKSYQRYNTPIKLSLTDLDILSDKNSPLHINYFYVRGIDDCETGPVLIPILNINYTNAIKVHGHEIEFNFTRMTGINYLGAKINF